MPTEQVDYNAATWARGAWADAYDHRRLQPAEVLLFARYEKWLSSRTLDVGCGAGRLLGYMVQLGAQVTGVDISTAMVKVCADRWPSADVRVGDLLGLPTLVEGPFDAIVLGDSVLDVLDDERRRAALTDLRGLLGPDGLLIFSSHNLAEHDHPTVPSGFRGAGLKATARAVATASPGRELARVIRMPRQRANRKRLAPGQYRAADHAIINDSGHEYRLLHYYIQRDDQARQLASLGFTLIDTLEPDGRSVPAGEDGRGAALYYVATPRQGRGDVLAADGGTATETT